jgi:aminopeptidase N
VKKVGMAWKESKNENSVVLATREAEIRRVEVRGQPSQKVLKTLSRKYSMQKKD